MIRIVRRTKQAAPKARVVFTGTINDEDLAALYSGADAFVFPSLYEGFGLPILEAMGCGCPVVCSNRGSLPEIAGKSAILVDPLDVAAISGAIETLLQDSATCESLVTSGKIRVKYFSWKLTAERTVELYKSLTA
jgi:alpha-1,3-rhamnosyl/mannosyltransferase